MLQSRPLTIVRPLAIVCLVCCFALSATLLALSACQIAYIGSNSAKNGVITLSVSEHETAQYNGFLPQCLRYQSYILVLASGICGVIDTSLLIFMLVKLESKKPSITRLLSFLRISLALCSILRSLAAVIWIWQAWTQYGSTEIVLDTPTLTPDLTLAITPASPLDGRYPAEAGCFTPEGWLWQLGDDILADTDEAVTWRRLASQAKAMRVLTIPVLVLYGVVFGAVLVGEREGRREKKMAEETREVSPPAAASFEMDVEVKS